MNVEIKRVVAADRCFFDCKIVRFDLSPFDVDRLIFMVVLRVGLISLERIGVIRNTAAAVVHRRHGCRYVFSARIGQGIGLHGHAVQLVAFLRRHGIDHRLAIRDNVGAGCEDRAAVRE